MSKVDGTAVVTIHASIPPWTPLGYVTGSPVVPVDGSVWLSCLGPQPISPNYPNQVAVAISVPMRPTCRGCNREIEGVAFNIDPQGLASCYEFHGGCAIEYIKGFMGWTQSPILCKPKELKPNPFYKEGG